LPDWAVTPAPDVARPTRPVSPSGLGGAKALPGEGALPEAEAMARGTALHLLLEVLPAHPPADWPAIAAGLPGCADPALLAEARGVLQAPALAHLFAPGTLAEVPLQAQLFGQPMDGVIDRLLVLPDRVLAVDFKSNTVVPASAAEVPDGLLRQMGAYAQALAQIYPDRKVEVALLWTAAAKLMPLPQDIVSAALARAAPP
jgi:ATP-dependent helicase/nuclease subunit A